MKFAKLREYDGRIGKILEWIENPIVAVVATVILYAPISTAILYYTTDSVREAADAYLSSALRNFLADHTLSITLGCLAISFVITNLPAILRKFAARTEPPVEALAALNEGFESLVQVKSQRFQLAWEKHCAARTPPGRIFREITQPEQQIAFTCHVLHEFFCAISKKVEFKVRIVSVKDEGPEGWFHFAPPSRPPQTTMDVIRNPASALAQSLKRKGIFIVEDVRAEIRKGSKSRYVPSHIDQDDERGSLLCYPVFHVPSKSTPYVLMISADSAYFKLELKPFYEWLLNQFALRINLEHSLLLLREKGG